MDSQTPNPMGSANTSPIRALMDAARDASPVSGLTHNFYRYPARFSPAFVKAAIDAFTNEGDWVLDPFVGGGTTLVEAMAAGRNAIGVDISSLSAFVCEAKTTVPCDKALSELADWQRQLPEKINIHGKTRTSLEYRSRGYYRNIDGKEFWRIRKAIEQALYSIDEIQTEAAKLIARCVVLRTAQWALDSRRTRPRIEEFRREIVSQATKMTSASLCFKSRVQSNYDSQPPRKVCLHRSSEGLEREEIFDEVGSPKLIITSPPYPGIHVLYHRWQVDGRKETPAPFWIANKLDGAGSSYYTMGDRKNPALNTYFDGLYRNFRSIANVAGRETKIVQMVAFSDPERQLPRYLEVLDSCGLAEMRPWCLADEPDGRLWRSVPNRKWHAQQCATAPGSREVVLVHTKA